MSMKLNFTDTGLKYEIDMLTCLDTAVQIMCHSLAIAKRLHRLEENKTQTAPHTDFSLLEYTSTYTVSYMCSQVKS